MQINVPTVRIVNEHNHTQSHTITHYHTLSHTITHNHTQSHTITLNHTNPAHKLVFYVSILAATGFYLIGHTGVNGFISGWWQQVEGEIVNGRNVYVTAGDFLWFDDRDQVWVNTNIVPGSWF